MYMSYLILLLTSQSADTCPAVYIAHANNNIDMYKENAVPYMISTLSSSVQPIATPVHTRQLDVCLNIQSTNTPRPS